MTDLEEIYILFFRYMSLQWRIEPQDPLVMRLVVRLDEMHIRQINLQNDNHQYDGNYHLYHESYLK